MGQKKIINILSCFCWGMGVTYVCVCVLDIRICSFSFSLQKFSFVIELCDCCVSSVFVCVHCPASGLASLKKFRRNRFIVKNKTELLSFFY